MGDIELMAEARRLGKRVIGYRISTDARTEAGEWVIARSVRLNTAGGFTFDVIVRLAGMVTYVSAVQLKVPGLHNVRNALAALSVAGLMGLPLKEAATVLCDFDGTGRRFELKGQAAGVTVIDDYAHHPTEIRATLSAARARYPGRRIWAVWQPHTYSRTQTLFDEFVLAFNDADEVIVSEIYAARELRQSLSGADVARAMHHPSARFIPDLDAIRDHLLAHLKTGDVLLVLSAGDADQVSREVLTQLKER
jgi:UDP-N-acetylmuramate--alanine ligase